MQPLLGADSCCNKLISMLKALITLLTRENFSFTHRGIRTWLLSSADQTNPNKTTLSFWRARWVNCLMKKVSGAVLTELQSSKPKCQEIICTVKFNQQNSANRVESQECFRQRQIYFYNGILCVIHSFTLSFFRTPIKLVMKKNVSPWYQCRW